MNRKSLLCIFLTIALLILGYTLSAIADGKLLRGEKWQRFTLQGKTADFYVAPNGNDSWTGMLDAPNSDNSDGPFATIERAQQAVRELKQKIYKLKDKPIEKRWIGSPHVFGKGRDILVLIRGGYYTLHNPLVFSPADGGERIETNLPSGAFEYHKLKDYYVTYAAFPGEIPIISGGKRINHWSRLNGIWFTPIKHITVENFIVNGKMQTLARSPNSGYFTPPKFSNSTKELFFKTGELEQWPQMENNRVIMLLRWHRGINTFSKVDETNNIAYLKNPQPGVVIVPPRYYVENVKSLLDAKGEWFFDQIKGELSYIPAQDINDPNSATTVVAHLKQLLIIKGEADKPVRNLRFYGLNFEATNSGSSGVMFEYAHSCELVDSEVRGMAGTGVLLTQGCYQNRIINNKLYGLDNGAVTIAGNAHPEKWMDIIRENRILYNSIDDCGGTNITATNTLFTTIAHNEITNSRGRYAISVGGWRNLEEAIDGGYRVEYNHLHQVQKDADDSGVIKTAGLTHDSIIRKNLIHDVKAGYFNDNVGFWFDNMSSGWLTEENIFYNLEQGEMKLCAANLVDNIYRNNFVIEAPENSPEAIIDGEPRYEYDDLRIELLNNNSAGNLNTGEFVKVTAQVKNTGSSGILPVDFYVEGKVVETKVFPVIYNNHRIIQFLTRFYEPGVHQVAIGTTPYQSINVCGEELSLIFDNLTVSDTISAAGEEIKVGALITNLRSGEQVIDAHIYLDERIFGTKSISLIGQASKRVEFTILPEKGIHTVRIGNCLPKTIKVYGNRAIDITNTDLLTYCSATAQPYEIDIDQEKNKYIIKAAGSDFFHAEDSYATAYLKKKVKGNFVATVKVTQFGNRTHEWFRAGLFARNEMVSSFDTQAGSVGSVLMFTTPGRAGIQWDEFGDGCMHRASSENLPENNPFPVWLKLVRHGNSFSGYLSYDAKTWHIAKHTTIVPGLAEAIDIGLAAGSCDQVPYWVEFNDFTLIVEQE